MVLMGDKWYEGISFNIPQPKSEIWLASGFVVSHAGPAPCRFHRFMQRVFFGFKWVDLTKEENHD